MEPLTGYEYLSDAELAQEFRQQIRKAYAYAGLELMRRGYEPSVQVIPEFALAYEKPVELHTTVGIERTSREAL